MQEIWKDGTEKLSVLENDEQLREALADERNASVRIHKPGSTFESRGQTYKVNDDGTLTKRERNKRKAKRRQARKSRKRNRQ